MFQVLGIGRGTSDMKKVYPFAIITLMVIVLGFIVWTSTSDKISGVILMIYLLLIFVVGKFLKMKKSYKAGIIVVVNLLFVFYLFIMFLG